MKNSILRCMIFLMTCFNFQAKAQVPDKSKMDTKYLLEEWDKNGFITRQEEKIYRKGSPGIRSKEKREKGIIERRTEYDGNTRIERDIIYAIEGKRKLPLDLYIPEKELARGKPLIEKIPDENQYKSDILKYFTVISYLGRIAAGDLSVQNDWKILDPESFKELSASNASRWE